ncbi:MAG: chloride channel protein [Salinivirgaceae bacterium]|jgi:CIC family chloride channel protein|nr:chloride channel protein [Salinivirgaceae bacterium]
MQKLFNTFLLWRLKYISDRSFILILSVIVGILAGLIAWALKSGVFYMHNFFRGDMRFNPRNVHLILYPLLGLSLTLLLKKFVLHDFIRHNIASILHAISKRNSLMRLHKIYSSVSGAILTAGFGGSIGLESPIISSGAALGSTIGKVCRLNYKSITLLLGCGAAGAIAAIFNTPIAGIVFALEVLLLDMNRFSLIPLLMASVSGAITTEILFTDEIFFEFAVSQSFSLTHVFYYIALGAIAGLCSHYFTKIFLLIENYFDTIKSPLKKLALGGTSLGLLIYIFPALYGEGYDIIKTMLSGKADQIFTDSLFAGSIDSTAVFIGFFMALILLKVIATALTIGAGGIGGIFAPSLFTGAILGYLFAVINNSIGIETLSVSNFALVGMASVLSGVLQAPLTGIFLIAEITSGYELIVPLMLATTISYVTSKFLSSHSIITEQLAKRGELITHHKDKAVLHFLSLKNVIETDFFPINEDATLGGLVKAISLSKRNIFPIINNEGELIGIILLDDVREIMFNTDWYNTSILNLMQIPPAIIDTEAHMEEVIRKFNETDAWNLPVCEKGRYIGFVSKSKLFSAYRTKLMDLTEE